MRLRPEEVERLVRRVLAEWKNLKLATFKAPETAIQAEMVGAFEKELRLEDELDKEAEALLGKYEEEFRKGTLDRRKMFQMVKNQLAKERKVIL